jgi:putative membrane protein
MAEQTCVETPDQAHLALERTFLAHERTLMAWVRTSASLITFGFTLYKLFFYLHELNPIRPPERLPRARNFGLFLIVIGVLALALAAWQYRLHMKRLRAYYENAPFSLSLLVAGLIAGLGIVALAAAALGV